MGERPDLAARTPHEETDRQEKNNNNELMCLALEAFGALVFLLGPCSRTNNSWAKELCTGGAGRNFPFGARSSDFATYGDLGTDSLAPFNFAELQIPAT